MMKSIPLKLNTVYLPLALLLVAMLFTACKPDNPDDPDEEEVITKVQLAFTDEATGTLAYTAVFSDPDGPGGNAPTRHDTIRLDSGHIYNATLTLLDESNPADIHDITEEVREEAADHIFCYTPTGVDATVSRTDTDGRFPIGITSRWEVGGPSTGSVRVELRHQPDQKDGTCTPGSTDVQVDFQLEIN